MRQQRDPVEHVRKLLIDNKLAEAGELKAIEKVGEGGGCWATRWLGTASAVCVAAIRREVLRTCGPGNCAMRLGIQKLYPRVPAPL